MTDSEDRQQIIALPAPTNVAPVQNQHVIILHEKLAKRSCDKYIISIALGFHQLGHKVTLLTSYFNKNEVIEDVSFLDTIDIKYSGWWIPRSICGFFRSSMSAIKAIWMAYRVLIFPPKPRPAFIVMDVDLWALYVIKFFSRNTKVFYVENFHALKNIDQCFDYSKIDPTLLEAKWIKLADEVIIESIGFADILKRSFPSLNKQPTILYAPIDTGLWLEPGIKIQRIIPDLLDNTILFLTIGKFKRSSNFKLALEAFEQLLDLIDDKSITKRFQLVIAGNCKTLEEKFYYNEITSETKLKYCASQITFIKQLPIIHEKTLISEAAIMIHPTKNDVSSDFLLRAISLGKPVVATNKGFAAKILVHRLSAVIIEPDPKLFAIAMKKLMMSPHLQIFLGDMAKDVFQKIYSFESFCDQINRMVTAYSLKVVKSGQNDKSKLSIKFKAG